MTISSIQAIAYAGVIGWVDPDVEWIQVEMATNIGDLIGYMERPSEDGHEVLPPIPTHLAFQLRRWATIIDPITGNIGNATEVYREVLGVLAIPHCLYDEWNSNNGGTPTPPATPYAACP